MARRIKVESPSDLPASPEEEVAEAPAESITPPAAQPPSQSTSPSTSQSTSMTRRLSDKQGNVMNLRDLKEMKISDLIELSKQYNVEGAAGMKRQDLIFA